MRVVCERRSGSSSACASCLSEFSNGVGASFAAFATAMVVGYGGLLCCDTSERACLGSFASWCEEEEEEEDDDENESACVIVMASARCTFRSFVLPMAVEPCRCLSGDARDDDDGAQLLRDERAEQNSKESFEEKRDEQKSPQIA